MSGHAENEMYFVRDVDWDDVGFRDRSGDQIDPNWVEHSGVQFRISASHVEQMLKIAKYYATMRYETSEMDLTFGTPITKRGRIVGYEYEDTAGYSFTTVPMFTNVDTITMGGKPVEFFGDWTEVTIWDEGKMMSFICKAHNGDELVFNASKHDFELFLAQKPDAAPPLRT